LAVGISTLIILQTLINIGGMLALLPLAGIPLPFVSYGGTSLIVSLAMLGVLTNASRETK
jgi:cell division protein FtsW